MRATLFLITIGGMALTHAASVRTLVKRDAENSTSTEVSNEATCPLNLSVY